MKKLHLFSGLLTLFVFIISGQFLEWVLPPFDGNLDGYRMMYRASHVYMMMAAIVNIMAGVYFVALTQGAWLITQHLGSFMVVLSQAFFIAAFIIEPGQNPAIRPYTITASILLIIGCFLVFLVFCLTAKHSRLR